MPQLSIIKSSVFTTLQDNGRFGVAHFGIPNSGVMDNYAFTFGNLLLNNSHNASVLELTYSGGIFNFSETTFIVVSGAECTITCNGKQVAQYKVLPITSNSILEISSFKKGARVYIAIQGGFKIENCFKSQSFYWPITKQQQLKSGDVIAYKPSMKSISTNVSVNYNTQYLHTNSLEVYEAPEYKYLTKTQKITLSKLQFTIDASSNRMAYQCKELFKNALQSITTAPVIPGTVQLTPSGKIIVLMKDCQTTGGYPRLFQLTEASISILAQKKPGDHISFVIVNL